VSSVVWAFKTEQPRATYRDLLRIWQEADEIPAFAQLWGFDHFVPLRADPGGPCLEGWTTLTALGVQTRRARIGLMVTGNTYRHPAVVANMAAALDVMTDGRLEFGIGAGWHEEEHRMYVLAYPSTADRIRALGEACQVIKALWTQDLSTFDGTFYMLRNARCEPKPVQSPHPPITIGGTGERLTLRVVARFADRWNYNGTTVEDFVRLNGVLDAHCAAVGRDPATIERSVQRKLGDDLPAEADAIRAFLDAGAQHVVLNPRLELRPGIAKRLLREVVEPLTGR
jgi:F420-dependent oxidoreductase-like protein